MECCKGCTWYNECSSDSRCDMYDNDNEEYGWNEMSYNLDNNIVRKSTHSVSDMISWYKANSKLD